jgi:hypothetical protein
VTDEPKGPVFYPDNAVLTIDQVAAGLQVSVRSAERLHLPVSPLGPQIRRYVWRQVVLHLEGLVEW